MRQPPTWVQLISPRDLLNRWIVPLDRRVDYLSLQYGVKFQIPFEVMVVFATNLDLTICSMYFAKA